MVSIGKLAAGQADYYLEQAHGRVNGADGVSSGVEDYYLGGGEAPGVWIGAGAVALGMRGAVGPSELRSVLANLDPRSGVELRRWGSVPGFDVTFSAPKSVSMLFGIGDDALRTTVRDAHDAAVREAFGYLERAAALARRGSASRGTLRWSPAAGWSPRRFVIAPRGRAIRSCTRTSWSRIWCRGRTGAGRRWTRGRCMRTRRPRAISTRRRCAAR